MAIRRIKVNGRKVWQARVAYHGVRKSTIRDTKGAARDAEAELLGELKTQAGQVEATAEAPATLRQLLEFYVLDLEARGKSPDTVTRARETEHVLARLLPELLDTPVSRLGDAGPYAFRKARLADSTTALRLLERSQRLRQAGRAEDADATERAAAIRQREGTKASTINRDLRTLRAALKKARPEYRFPGGAFLKEDETRVRWLRPEEELLVLETMRSPFREIAKVAALTLMRLSEIRLLRREHVHLE